MASVMETPEPTPLVVTGEETETQRREADPTSWEAAESSWERSLRLQELLEDRHDFQAPLRVLRVNQLDATKLDEELNDILKGQFMKIFTFFKPSLIEKWQPELKAFLHLLIFRCSIYATNSTYGNKLQNLEYRNEIPHELARDIATATKTPLNLGQKLGYAILTIGGSWMWERLNAVSVANAWGDQPEESRYRRLWVLLNRLESAFKILSLLNFLVFLYDGKYLTLVERFLRMRLVYSHPSLARFVSFEFMNRYLVWHGFTEFFAVFDASDELREAEADDNEEDLPSIHQSKRSKSLSMPSVSS